MWDNPAECRQTLVLLPEDVSHDEDLEQLMRQAPAVIPVTVPQLLEMLDLLVRECE